MIRYNWALALVIFFLFILPITIWSQCQLTSETDTLRITGNQDPSSSYLVYLKIKSDSSGQFKAELQDLRVKNSSQVVEMPVEITPATFDLDGNETQRIPLKFKGFSISGMFSGMVKISSINGNCPPAYVPLKVNIKPNLISIPPDEDQIELMTVNRSFLYRLVPPRLRNKNILIAINNQGVTDVTVTGQSLLIRGETTGQALTMEDLGIAKQTFLLKAGERNILRLELDKTKKFDPDKYSGTLELYLEGDLAPKTVEIDLYLRGGIFGAIMALLLGLLLGYFIRDLNRNKVQVEWMTKIFDFKVKLATLRSNKAKELLRLELEEIEKKLNNITNTEVLKTVQTDFETIQKKFEVIQNAESLGQKIKSTDPKADIEAKVNKIVTSCINEDFATAELGIQSLSGILASKLDPTEAAPAPRTRGAGTRGPAPTAEEDPSSSKEGKGIWWKRILRFFTTMPKVRFFIFRPIMYAALLTLILLWGLQEIYFSDASNTFGVDGIYDYVKLFGWGAASKVFSWQVIGKNLLGWKAANPAATGE